MKTKLLTRIRTFFARVHEFYTLPQRLDDLSVKLLTARLKFIELKSQFNEYDRLIATAECQLRTRAEGFERGNALLSDQIVALTRRIEILEWETRGQWQKSVPTHSKPQPPRAGACDLTTEINQSRMVSAAPLKTNGPEPTTGSRFTNPGQG
jgi:hypothetical protein